MGSPPVSAFIRASFSCGLICFDCGCKPPAWQCRNIIRDRGARLQFKRREWQVAGEVADHMSEDVQKRAFAIGPHAMTAKKALFGDVSGQRIPNRSMDI